MSSDLRQSYKNYMHALYFSSPALRKFIVEHQDWYAPGFVRSLPDHI